MAIAEPPKRRRGRQPLPPEERTSIISTRLKPIDLEELTSEAEEEGVTLAEAVRHVLMQWCRVKREAHEEGRSEELEAALAFGRRCVEMLNERGVGYEDILLHLGTAARQTLAVEHRKERSRRWRVIEKAETPGCS